MESINKVELQGNVGNIRIQEAGEKKVAHISLATNRVARNRDGESYVEASWHSIEAWEGQNIADFGKIAKGCWLHVTGRLKYSKYTGNDNVERTTVDIVASKLEVLDTEPAN